MQRIVDLSTDGLYLSIERGFLAVSNRDQQLGRIPLDDIGGLIGNAHGLTWSSGVAVELATRAVPMVLCAPNHKPVACLWPIEGHHLQNLRMRQQSDASKPLLKQLWQQIVVAKIQMQAAVLHSIDQPAERLKALARAVRSGDASNHEAQAARIYWPLLLGNSFRRDQNAGGVNGLLNYGYTILRSCIARAVCAAGLHPTLALHHSNRSNAFALVDDLMEPFRPLVDSMVFDLIVRGETEVSPATKKLLCRLADLDLPQGAVTSPLRQHCQALAQSLSQCFSGEIKNLALPDVPAPTLLRSLLNQAES
jgi:CRISP-associated protein Cas1